MNARHIFTPAYIFFDVKSQKKLCCRLVCLFTVYLSQVRAMRNAVTIYSYYMGSSIVTVKVSVHKLTGDRDVVMGNDNHPRAPIEHSTDGEGARGEEPRD
jgi:hypothetical protein